MSIPVSKAKAKFSEAVRRIEPSENVILTQDEASVARLVQVHRDPFDGLPLAQAATEDLRTLATDTVYRRNDALMA